MIWDDPEGRHLQVIQMQLSLKLQKCATQKLMNVR